MSAAPQALDAALRGFGVVEAEGHRFSKKTCPEAVLTM